MISVGSLSWRVPLYLDSYDCIMPLRYILLSTTHRSAPSDARGSGGRRYLHGSDEDTDLRPRPMERPQPVQGPRPLASLHCASGLSSRRCGAAGTEQGRRPLRRTPQRKRKTAIRLKQKGATRKQVFRRCGSRTAA